LFDVLFPMVEKPDRRRYGKISSVGSFCCQVKFYYITKISFSNPNVSIFRRYQDIKGGNLPFSGFSPLPLKTPRKYGACHFPRNRPV